MSGTAGVDAVPTWVRAANITAKVGLVLMLLLALLYPDTGNMRDKAAGVRAVGYPLVAFLVPVLWWSLWSDRKPFPWLADLLVSVTCFSDILGNRLDLYDTVVWFDDWMHVFNTGMVSAAVILLTLHRSTGLGAVVERALAFGVTAAVLWEIAEYFAFLARSTERHFAYADTLSDLGLGLLGAVLAAVVVHRMWQAGGLRQVEPLTGRAHGPTEPERPAAEWRAAP